MKLSRSVILVRTAIVSLAAAWLCSSGCDSVSIPVSLSGSSGSASTPTDPFSDAIADAEPGEKRYIEAVKPALEAIVKSDWKTFYNSLSTHAKAKMNTFQFDQIPKSGAQEPEQKVVTAPDEKAYMDLVARFEAAYGKPKKLNFLHVQSTAPEVLSGKGNNVDSLFAIGAMPSEIPSDIRKASMRAQFEREFKPEEVTIIAKELEISEDDVRAGNWPDDSDIDENPYFNFKCVLVEENGELKIGYFEFMPPSMFD